MLRESSKVGNMRTLIAGIFILATSSNCTDIPYNCPSDWECDPNEINCNNSCYKDRYVFLTSSSYKGYDIGGIEGANNICNNLAKKAGLFNDLEISRKPMIAWISDTNHGVTDFAKFGKGRYVLPSANFDNILIAESFTEILTGEKLNHSINHDENGFELLGETVWTNTKTNGEIYDSNQIGTCNDWSVPCQQNDECLGFVGRADSIDSSWTEIQPPDNASDCNLPSHLYCIEIDWE